MKQNHLVNYNKYTSNSNKKILKQHLKDVIIGMNKKYNVSTDYQSGLNYGDTHNTASVRAANDPIILKREELENLCGNEGLAQQYN